MALDRDYDGHISVEEVYRYFGNDVEIDFDDLKKLIQDKDSRKIGQVTFTDFSRWLGAAIHQSEGFYFRHDSHKNPIYDVHLRKFEANAEMMRTTQSHNTDALRKQVLDKIGNQWKTLRKAFMDMNMEKSGSIKPNELRFYLKHWGIMISDAEFAKLFAQFDADGDGYISYKDFVKTVGTEIHPSEGLYFR